nr:putative ribonuclease H-like domain-containing protein [Tanacetum cinerariifolium]
MIQVCLNETVRNIITDNGIEDVIILHQTTVARSPQQNIFVERQNRTLVEATHTMLIFSKALLFLWAEAVAIAFYTQNRSLIQKHHNKTPYELLHDWKPDLSYLYVFAALCYPTIDSEDLDCDELTMIASKQFSSRPEPQLMTLVTITSGLPMFDEYFNLPPCVDHPVPVVTAQEPANSTGPHFSTTVYHDTSLPKTLMVEKSKLDGDPQEKVITPVAKIPKNTSGSLQLLGDRLVSWSSKKQKSTVISSTEAGYIALSGCCAQVLWMRSQLMDYRLGF